MEPSTWTDQDVEDYLWETLGYSLDLEAILETHTIQWVFDPDKNVLKYCFVPKPASVHPSRWMSIQ